MAVSATNMQSGERRLVYGFNVGVSIVVATAIFVLLLALAGEYRRQFDWTRTGINSLSGRTVQLLRGLDQSVRVTALYPVRTETRQTDERRRRTVGDLLALYAAQGGGQVSATVIDPLQDQNALRELLTRLKGKPAYADEAAAHQAVLDAFVELSGPLAAALTNEYRALLELGGAHPSLGTHNEFGLVALNLRNVGEQAQSLQGTVQDLMLDEAPRFGEALRRVQDFVAASVNDTELVLAWMAGERGNRPRNLPPEVMDHFAAFREEVTPLLERLRELQTQAQGLPELELEALFQRLRGVIDRPPIVVETDAEAYVIPFTDIWSRPTQQAVAAGAEEFDFLGEQAVSSAILRLTQAEKTGVVFVRFGGTPLLAPDPQHMMNMSMAQPPSAPYQMMNRMLEQANFVTGEWDVRTQPTPPTLEDAVRTVYVVLPPAPPEQVDPLTPGRNPGISFEQKRSVYGAIGEAGRAVFLAGWQPPTNPMSTRGGTYEYGDYLRDTWGLDVKATHLAMVFAPSPQRDDAWVPLSDLYSEADGLTLVTQNGLELTDHPIAAPLQQSTAGLPLACPLEVLSDPNGPQVTWQPVARVEPTERVWAVADYVRPRREAREKLGTTPAAEDIRAPFSVVMAGEQDGQRLVVFASDRFAADAIAQARGATLRGNALVQFMIYPANADLLINSLHWLTGDADRIAVGPQRGTLPRLDKLTRGGEMFCRVFIVGVWPALALAAGGVMWLLRRR